MTETNEQEIRAPRIEVCGCTQIPELGPCEHNELADKTWMQLRQCTRIALYYLRGQAKDEYAPAKKILAKMDKVLTEGSTDPVR